MSRDVNLIKLGESLQSIIIIRESFNSCMVASK